MASVCSSASAAKVPSLPTQNRMIGQAFLTRPVSFGKVRLYSIQGKPLPAGAYSARTSRDGLFTVSPKRLPDDFKVVVTGGRMGGARLGGRLITVVDHYDGTSNIGVSGATTLVAAYVLHHPRQSVSKAAAHATAYLGLPPGYGEAPGLSFDALHFSEAKFVSLAEAAGGINAYVNKVERRIDQRQPIPSFVPLSAGNPLSIALAGITALVKVWKFSQCTAERKSVELGCVVEAFDGGKADGQAQLEALQGIHDQLVGVSNQISQLQTQLSNQIAALHNTVVQTQWNTVINSFQNSFYGPIGAAYTDLMIATDTSYPEKDRQMSSKAAKGIIMELRNHNADETMAKTLLPQAGATGALAQFSDLVRNQAGRFFGTSSRYWGNGYAGLIQDEWQFFQSWQAKLEYLLVEGANAEGYSKRYVDENVLQPFLGVPVGKESGGQLVPVPASEKGHVDCSDKPVAASTSCLGWLDQESEAVGLPLQPGLVIDTKTGLMWAQMIMNYHSPVQDDQGDGSLSWAKHTIKDVYNGPYSDWGDFKNWRLPTEQELQGLFTGNTPDLRGHLSTLGGFYNNPPGWASHQSLNQFGGVYPYVWTSSFSGGQTVLGDLATGQVALNGNPASVIAVREITPCERYYYDISTSAPPLCK
ncbi:MAG: hypothetical protein WAL22_21490 [Solirubrobacteraceae bacterium]